MLNFKVFGCYLNISGKNPKYGRGHVSFVFLVNLRVTSRDETKLVTFRFHIVSQGENLGKFKKSRLIFPLIFKNSIGKLSPKDKFLPLYFVFVQNETKVNHQ